MFVEDLSESNEQYLRIAGRKEIYTSTRVISSKVFDELERTAQDLTTKIDNGLIEDFSISEIFENSEYDTLKSFVYLKTIMNEIDSRYDEAKEKNTKKSNNKKTLKYDDEQYL